MAVTVLNHQHDAALVFEGVGDGQTLIIQTGTIIFDFEGSPDEGGWVRDRLTQMVLDLPVPSLVLASHVQAIASAAPASMNYVPGLAPGTTSGTNGLFAQGNVFLTGSETGGGGV